MQIKFYKYQGTGNDFVMIDERQDTHHLSEEQVAFLCHRKFGIGADGFIAIRNHEEVDFEMVYHNSDGKLGSMCGNGARCTVAFAKKLGCFEGKETRFMAYDGLHQAFIQISDKDNATIVELQMSNVSKIEHKPTSYFLDTGSPHVVEFVRQVDEINVLEAGRKIRYNERFSEKGTNVNFVSLDNQNSEKNSIFVRTYERGVENETLSCGTGVTASAIGHVLKEHPEQKTGGFLVHVKTLGGDLKVRLQRKENEFTHIFLIGAATPVFEGTISL